MDQPPTLATPRLESLLDTLKNSPETFDDLDASMLFLETNFFDFRVYLRQLKEMGRSFSLVFSMEDLGKTPDEKIIRLRHLKVLREDPKTIKKITVKGKKGEVMLEPNVFTSGVDFEVMPE